MRPKSRHGSENENRVRVWISGTMTNWQSMEMVHARGETEYCVIIECYEGDVYYKFCVSKGGSDDKESLEWVVDSTQEITSVKNSYNCAIKANVIKITKTDREVFAALTVDSFCVKRTSSEHEEEGRKKSEHIWAQEIPKYDKANKNIDKKIDKFISNNTNLLQ